jgi:AcrR family transcriptional regulator
VPPTERGRQTRDALVQVATDLFAERGVDGVTVDEICVASGVAKGTFYVHFRQKEDVLFAAFAASMTGVADRMRAAIEDDLPTRELLAAFARSMHWLGQVDRATVTLTIGEFLARPDDFASYQTSAGLPRDQVLPLVVLGQRRGDLRPDVPAAELAALIESVWMGVVLRWARQGRGGRLEAELLAALDLLVVGIGADRGP